MTKTIIITFDNKDKFSLPAEIVAKHRTEYYKSKEEEDFNYDEEFANSMEDDELHDWLGNNMDWVDIKDHVTKLETKKPNYDELWSEGVDFKIKN